MGWQRLPAATKAQSAGFSAFRKRTRFLVDESLGEAVARVLGYLGWNAVFGPDMGLRGHSDEDVFGFAWREQRVLLTHDRGFLDDRRFPPHRNPGVIVLPGASGAGRGLVEGLRAILSIVAPYRKAFRRFKIEITEDGVWNITNMTRATDVVRRWRLRPGSGSVVDEWEDNRARDDAMPNKRLQPAATLGRRQRQRRSSRG
jgi:hypothetical protein